MNLQANTSMGPYVNHDHPLSRACALSGLQKPTLIPITHTKHARPSLGRALLTKQGVAAPASPDSPRLVTVVSAHSLSYCSATADRPIYVCRLSPPTSTCAEYYLHIFHECAYPVEQPTFMNKPNATVCHPLVIY